MNKDARDAIYWMLSGSALTCGVASAVVPDEAGLPCAYAATILMVAFFALLFSGWFR